MSDAFEYRPKFVDIRVKKPDPEAKIYGRTKSNDPACDHVGCDKPGRHRAPKSRDHANQFWNFCADHVADYNKRWNYFAGMSEGEMKNYQKAEETGHRPTWTFRSGRLDRFSAGMRGFKGGGADPFGMVGGEARGEAAGPVRQSRRLTRLQRAALETMALTEDATGADIRAKYAELVKRWHPDSNGGSRDAEAQLQRVLNAYQHLKAGGLV
jgi:hypothetical protein